MHIGGANHKEEYGNVPSTCYEMYPNLFLLDRGWLVAIADCYYERRKTEGDFSSQLKGLLGC